MGAGTQLIDAAKASGIGALELWCFQANERARRFYEHEASTRSVLLMVRKMRSERPTSGIVGHDKSTESQPQFDRMKAMLQRVRTCRRLPPWLDRAF
jgi:hypothetical protein